MYNVATVGFEIAPDRYAVLKALAVSEGVSVSEFVRQTVEEALDLEQQVERLADFSRRQKPSARARLGDAHGTAGPGVALLPRDKRPGPGHPSRTVRTAHGWMRDRNVPELRNGRKYAARTGDSVFRYSYSVVRNSNE